MAKLDEIVKHPNYTAAASSASKATIFVFITTFAYLAFFSGISPGLIGGAAFFFIGIFVVSLTISMPLFLLRAKVPRLGLLISLTDIALTIFLKELDEQARQIFGPTRFARWPRPLSLKR
jgi:hypothetical protein